jgi:hypothetical protein
VHVYLATSRLLLVGRLKSLYRECGFAPGQMCSEAVRSLPRNLTTDQALLLLAIEPGDAGALVCIYDNHYRQLKRTATRFFGRDPEVLAKVVNSILAAIARQAATYNPQSEDATRWIGRYTEAEARRLRQLLHSNGKTSRRARSRV